jgi:hypothetical protein
VVDQGVLKTLEHARSRLGMVFETPARYLDFWYPNQNLTLEALSPDLADYYLYDLEEVDGGYKPKASRAAVTEDMDSVSWKSPTAAEMGETSGAPWGAPWRSCAPRRALPPVALPSSPTRPETP